MQVTLKSSIPWLLSLLLCNINLFCFLLHRNILENILLSGRPARGQRVVGLTQDTRSCLPLSGTITWKKDEQVKQASSLSMNNFIIFSAYGHGEFGATSVSSRITVALRPEMHSIPICLEDFLTCHCSTSSTCYEQILQPAFYFTAGNCWVLLEFQKQSLRSWGFLYINANKHTWQKPLSSLELWTS